MQGLETRWVWKDLWTPRTERHILSGSRVHVSPFPASSLPDPTSLYHGVYPAMSGVCRQHLGRSALETWERKYCLQRVRWGGPLETTSYEVLVGLLSEPQKPHEAQARPGLRKVVGLGRHGCLQGAPLLRVPHTRGVGLEVPCLNQESRSGITNSVLVKTTTKNHTNTPQNKKTPDFFLC